MKHFLSKINILSIKHIRSPKKLFYSFNVPYKNALLILNFNFVIRANNYLCDSWASLKSWYIFWFCISISAISWNLMLISDLIEYILLKKHNLLEYHELKKKNY